MKYAYNEHVCCCCRQPVRDLRFFPIDLLDDDRIDFTTSKHAGLCEECLDRLRDMVGREVKYIRAHVDDDLIDEDPPQDDDVTSPPPRPSKPEPGWYAVRYGGQPCFRRVREDSDRLCDGNGNMHDYWTEYEFGPKLPEGWKP